MNLLFEQRMNFKKKDGMFCREDKKNISLIRLQNGVQKQKVLEK
jgi:hypothetical protein